MPRQGTDYADEDFWSEVIIRNGLSPSLVDDPLFRKTLVTTDRMGQSTVCMDFSKMKAQYSMFVDDVSSKQVCVSICMPLHYAYLCQTQLITLCVHHRFDDEVKDDIHSVLTPGMMNLPQGTGIETFVEDVTDKSTGLPIFKELVWFTYKVSGVMCAQCLNVGFPPP
jgi:hypothetical protein